MATENRSMHDDNFLVMNKGVNPVVGFNFVLRVELLFDLPCKSIKAFTRENEYEFIQEGGLNDYVHMRRKPISKPFTFEVERYIGVDYIDPLPNGAELALPVILIITRQAAQHHTPEKWARMYAFTGCTVMKKTYGELNAEKSELMTETTTIAFREMILLDLPWNDFLRPDEFKNSSIYEKQVNTKEEEDLIDDIKKLEKEKEKLEEKRKKCNDELADLNRKLKDLDYEREKKEKEINESFENGQQELKEKLDKKEITQAEYDKKMEELKSKYDKKIEEFKKKEDEYKKKKAELEKKIEEKKKEFNELKTQIDEKNTQIEQKKKDLQNHRNDVKNA